MKLFRFCDEDLKCGGCNWRVSCLYVLADNEEEAKKLFEEGEALCASCMCDMLVEEEYRILSEEEQKEKSENKEGR